MARTMSDTASEVGSGIQLLITLCAFHELVSVISNNLVPSLKLQNITFRHYFRLNRLIHMSGAGVSLLPFYEYETVKSLLPASTLCGIFPEGHVQGEL